MTPLARAPWSLGNSSSYGKSYPHERFPALSVLALLPAPSGQYPGLAGRAVSGGGSVWGEARCSPEAFPTLRVCACAVLCGFLKNQTQPNPGC